MWTTLLLFSFVMRLPALSLDIGSPPADGVRQWVGSTKGIGCGKLLYTCSWGVISLLLEAAETDTMGSSSCGGCNRRLHP